MSLLTGVILAVLAAIPPTLLIPSLQTAYVYIVALAIPAIYIFFALRKEDHLTIKKEAMVFGIFSLIASVGYFFYFPLLIASIGLHGFWDLVHSHDVDSRIPKWYPPFCFVFDITFAVLMITLLD